MRAMETEYDAGRLVSKIAMVFLGLDIVWSFEHAFYLGSLVAAKNHFALRNLASQTRPQPTQDQEETALRKWKNFVGQHGSKILGNAGRAHSNPNLPSFQVGLLEDVAAVLNRSSGMIVARDLGSAWDAFSHRAWMEMLVARAGSGLQRKSQEANITGTFVKLKSRRRMADQHRESRGNMQFVSSTDMRYELKHYTGTRRASEVVSVVFARGSGHTDDIVMDFGQEVRLRLGSMWKTEEVVSVLLKLSRTKWLFVAQLCPPLSSMFQLSLYHRFTPVVVLLPTLPCAKCSTPRPQFQCDCNTFLLHALTFRTRLALAKSSELVTIPGLGSRDGLEQFLMSFGFVELHDTTRRRRDILIKYLKVLDDNNTSIQHFLTMDTISRPLDPRLMVYPVRWPVRFSTPEALTSSCLQHLYANMVRVRQHDTAKAQRVQSRCECVPIMSFMAGWALTWLQPQWWILPSLGSNPCSEALVAARMLHGDRNGKPIDIAKVRASKAHERKFFSFLHRLMFGFSQGCRPKHDSYCVVFLRIDAFLIPVWIEPNAGTDFDLWVSGNAVLVTRRGGTVVVGVASFDAGIPGRRRLGPLSRPQSIDLGLSPRPAWQG